MRRDVFQPIADPTRRAILTLVAMQAMTPNSLAGHFDITRQAVSSHLKMLMESKLVSQEQTGREIFYHLNAHEMRALEDWLAPFRNLWQDQFVRLDSILFTQIKSGKNVK